MCSISLALKSPAMKSPEDKVRKLADSLMPDDPMLAACLTYIVILSKNDALPAVYEQLGELISRLTHEQSIALKDKPARGRAVID